jgi:hypothetical protein
VEESKIVRDAPFKVFVSSPVYEIEDFRRAVAQAADVTNAGHIFNPRFHVFLYEQHDNQMDPALSPSENIVRTFGEHCDAFIVFFRDRVGNGTLEEFEIFRTRFRVQNPNCQLWWAQIRVNPVPPPVQDFCGRLIQEGGREMPAIRDQLTVESPDHLKERVISRLMGLLMSAP